MAIYHCSIKPISRSSGRSSVAASAYRAAAKLENKFNGTIHDYSRRNGVIDSEIILPNNAQASWAKDREELWNIAERSERRQDARTAREIVVALPHELSAEQRNVLVRAFAQDIANGYGVAVDYAIHAPGLKGDERNVHAHLLLTTRKVVPDGLGEKSSLERENKWLLNHNQPTTQMQINGIRRGWEHFANNALALAGHDARIDHRSHAERGLEIVPTEKMGVHATAIERKGGHVSRVRCDEETARHNGALIVEKPEQVLTLVASHKSVFDRHDIARVLNRYLGSDIEAFQNALAAVMQLPSLVKLQSGDAGELAKYSTREMVELERGMAERSVRMAGQGGFGISDSVVMAGVDKQNRQMRQDVAVDYADRVERGEISKVRASMEVAKVRLSHEQEGAVRHIVGDEQISVVVGYAGAGKSTMLAAAREAWEMSGHRVLGASLSGKAAAGLQESSGIPSRTLASWEMSWGNDRGLLQRGDIFVIDEAGMLGSRQLAHFLAEAEQRGAKVVLVGDAEQLQPINAGAAFKMIAERVGSVELQDIRRQRQEWQREASQAFATGRTAEALQVYERRGRVRLMESDTAAQAAIVRDYMADIVERPGGSRVALAHRRVDVAELNRVIREELQRRGLLAKGQENGEIIFNTDSGEHAFARGDRIVFLENSKDLDVKNGMLATVEAVRGDQLVARLDGGERTVTLSAGQYGAFDHGYATTIHKSQGETVDRAFVMASSMMDRHMTYVAMTRHREDVRLYASRDQFRDMATLYEVMGRRGTKETTLDYTERQGREEPGQEVEQGRRAAVAENTVRETQAENVPGGAQEAPKAATVRVLFPAVHHYVHTVEEVAEQQVRENRAFMDDQRQLMDFAARVFKDPEQAVGRIQGSLEQGMSVEKIQGILSKYPERAGELCGKSGLLGANRERKEAKSYVSNLVGRVKVLHDYKARLKAAETKVEQVRRDSDKIVVPIISRTSLAILKKIDELPHETRDLVIREALKDPIGQKAFAEAGQMHEALEERFGSDYRSRMGEHIDRLASVTGKQVEDKTLKTIKSLVRLVEKSNSNKLSHQHNIERERQRDLKREISRSRGRGWER